MTAPAELSWVAHDLLARYAWAIDGRAYGELAHVFVADVEADYEAFRCHDVEALIKRMESLHRDLDATQHLVGGVLVVPGERVRVRSHVQATLVRRTGDLRGRLTVGASYDDVLVETDDGWRIAERSVRGLWADGAKAILPWFEGPDR